MGAGDDSGRAHLRDEAPGGDERPNGTEKSREKEKEERKEVDVSRGETNLRGSQQRASDRIARAALHIYPAAAGPQRRTDDARAARTEKCHMSHLRSLHHAWPAGAEILCHHIHGLARWLRGFEFRGLSLGELDSDHSPIPSRKEETRRKLLETRFGEILT